MSLHNTLIVVSHYNLRSKEILQGLIKSLINGRYDIVVVVNHDDINSIHHDFYCPGVMRINRPNTGMNIGAWDCAFREFPDYKYYLFLQDECVIKKYSFIEAYHERFLDEKIGMIGESINFKWNMNWNLISNSPINYAVGLNNYGNKVGRVEYYLHMMKKWGIESGVTGRHLRALVWALKGDVLSKINGFPIGASKEECIAAEIAVSKSVEQIGLRVEQVDADPFKYIQHTEWRNDGSSKI